MRPDPGNHPEEERIEAYSRGVLPDEEAARLEEHLLICELCQGRLAESDAYVSAIRAAAADMRPVPLRPKARWFLPMVAMAAALAVMAWVGVRAGRMNGPERTVTVLLAANRGAIEAHAPAGRALLLELDLEGLPESHGSFGLEIVNSSRARVWQGSAPNGRTARVAVPALPPGVYFVHVSAAGGELLREYGLEVGKN
jgi:hypothetical protein